jgi:alkanesulfonate monooxygenase SsuD/methylene tetrahydromethanopterin reductase-like flavin-dependent oxidoreductase (luciferase family)
LAATERIVTGTGIANVWARHPATMQGGAATPGAAYPGRFVLGVGISHAPMVEGSGQAYEKPLALAPISGIVVRYNAATASVRIQQPSTWLHEPAVHFESQR